MKKSIRILALAMVTVILCLALASCGGPNADPDKALEGLKENGIKLAAKDDVIVPTALNVAFKLSGVDAKIEDVVSGTGEIDEEFATITIVYFEDADQAKAAMEDVESYANKNKDDKAKDNWVFKQSGKMIYFGTKNAVKAAA